METFGRVAKLMFWKLCFPESVQVLPPALQIVSGPFKGMRYTTRSHGSYHSCKVLGTYEKELHDVIASIQAHHYDTLIDIGAAEGYYAVGLAATSVIDRIIAFEAAEKGRLLLTEIAKWNAVKTPLDLLGRCEIEDLTSALASSGNTLIICDVEGYEAVLLDPELVTGLREASIMVELHEFARRGIGNLIRDRFASSHMISEIVGTPRTWEDFPQKRLTSRIMPRKLAVRAMNEGRAESMTWLWMVPNANAMPHQ